MQAHAGNDEFFELFDAALMSYEAHKIQGTLPNNFGENDDTPTDEE
jgi:hypothetical protein